MWRWRLVHAADAFVVAVVLLLTVPTSIGLLWSAASWSSWIGGGCVAVLVAALLGRRPRPWLSFWGSCAALLVLLALPSLPDGPSMVFLPVSLVHVFVLHAVVADTGRWRLPLTVSTLGLGLILARTVRDVPDPLDWGAFWVFVPFTVLVLAGSCVLGARDWERRRQQERRMQDAVIQERELMAREVHDVVASGFLTKDTPGADVADAIREVHAGRSVVSPRATRALIDRIARATPDAAAVAADLSPRERDVLALLARGFSNAEIARELFVAESTVKTHVSSLTRKVGVRDRLHVVVWAYQNGIF